jgi:hypothetical protein
MPILNAPVLSEGPIVRALVHVSAARAEAMQNAGLQLPQAEIITALLDTGVSCTAIDPSILKKLGIPATGSVPILTPSTDQKPHICNQYDVLLAIITSHPSHYHVVSLTLPIIETNLSLQGIQGLIGRDILSKGVFWYNGHENSFSLAF